MKWPFPPYFWKLIKYTRLSKIRKIAILRGPKLSRCWSDWNEILTDKNMRWNLYNRKNRSQKDWTTAELWASQKRDFSDFRKMRVFYQLPFHKGKSLISAVIFKIALARSKMLQIQFWSKIRDFRLVKGGFPPNAEKKFFEIFSIFFIAIFFATLHKKRSVFGFLVHWGGNFKRAKLREYWSIWDVLTSFWKRELQFGAKSGTFFCLKTPG